MKTKQTSEEILANVKALVEYLASKGKQLILVDEVRKTPSLIDQMTSNVNQIDGHCLIHFTDKKSGLTDQSFVNLKKTVSALKQSLHWMKDKAPIENKSGVQDESKGRASRREDASANVGSVRKIVADGAAKQAAERDASILRGVEAFCQRHTNHPHSRTYKERDELQKEFKRLVAQKVKPAEIDKKVRALAGSFFSEKRQR